MDGPINGSAGIDGIDQLVVELVIGQANAAQPLPIGFSKGTLAVPLQLVKGLATFDFFLGVARLNKAVGQHLEHQLAFGAHAPMDLAKKLEFIALPIRGVGILNAAQFGIASDLQALIEQGRVALDGQAFPIAAQKGIAEGDKFGPRVEVTQGDSAIGLRTLVNQLKFGG